MRYEDDDDADAYKQSIGLGTQEKKSKFSGFKDFLKWYFTIDLKDWTNYVAIVLAALLFWWGIKTIIKTMSMG